MLKPPSGYWIARDNVLAGLGEIDEDMSPNPLSLLYEPTRSCDSARSLAFSKASIHSSTVPASTLDEVDFGCSNW